MRVLLLGAYGFIGTAILRALLDAGHSVAGLGRDVGHAKIRWPQVDWIEEDLRDLGDPKDWHTYLANMDVVINAAGVLQDGADDDVAAVQFDAMQALYRACVQIGPNRVVQISAVGAQSNAPTRFMTTKAKADAALAATNLDWIILRPGLVIGPSAYGATALLRALAAFPIVLPIGLGDARLQCVGIEEVAQAARRAIEGRLPYRQSYDLVEDTSCSLVDIIIALREWLGLSPAPVVKLPRIVLAAACRVGDALGYLGWRPPLRTTALMQIADSVTGDPTAWRNVTGQSLASLPLILQNMPGSVQERWFARLYLLKPVIVATLTLFWIVSGLIGLWRWPSAVAILTAHHMPKLIASLCVGTGSLLDIALGTAALMKPWLRPAALGMAGLSFLYLFGGSLFAGDLWRDPLGPLLKILPGLILALTAVAISDDR